MVLEEEGIGALSGSEERMIRLRSEHGTQCLGLSHCDGTSSGERVSRWGAVESVVSS